MSTLGHFMQDLAKEMGVSFQVQDGVYSMDMPTMDGRCQLVNVTVQESGIGGEMLLFYTPVGPMTEDIDLRDLLELNIGSTVYARVGIVAEHIVVAAGQMLDSADVSEVIAMLAEVGAMGDMLEKHYFGQEDRF